MALEFNTLGNKFKVLIPGQVPSLGKLAVANALSGEDAVNLQTLGLALGLPSGTLPTSTIPFIRSTAGIVLVTGTKTVADTAIRATSVIVPTRTVAGGTTGNFTYTISAGVSYTITSTNALDTSTVTAVIIG